MPTPKTPPNKQQAKDNPGKLQEMKDLFDREGRTYNVYPIDNSRTSVRFISVVRGSLGSSPTYLSSLKTPKSVIKNTKKAPTLTHFPDTPPPPTQRLDVSTRPSLMRGRTNITFYQGMIRTPEGAAPDFKNKDFNLTVSARACVGRLIGSKGIDPCCRSPVHRFWVNPPPPHTHTYTHWTRLISKPRPTNTPTPTGRRDPPLRGGERRAGDHRRALLGLVVVHAGRVSRALYDSVARVIVDRSSPAACLPYSTYTRVPCPLSPLTHTHT